MGNYSYFCLQINGVGKSIMHSKFITMKRKSLFLVLLCVLVVVFASCKKENPKPDNQATQSEEPAPVSKLAAFAGHYQLEITVEGSYVDDQIADVQTTSYEGTLDIGEPQVVNGVEQVTVKGSFNFGGGDILQVYNTTGTLDAQNRLVLAKSNFTAVSGAELGVDYGTVSLANPLSFTSTLSCELMGYSLRYELSNMALKQE